MARCADADRRRAAADRGVLRAGLRRDVHVLPEPRLVSHGHVPVAARREADADPGRPLAGPAQPARRRSALSLVTDWRLSESSPIFAS